MANNVAVWVIHRAHSADSCVFHSIHRFAGKYSVVARETWSGLRNALGLATTADTWQSGRRLFSCDAGRFVDTPEGPLYDVEASLPLGGTGRRDHREAYVSTKHSQAQEAARLPRPYVHARRPTYPRQPPQEGPLRSERLGWRRHRANS